MADSGLGKVITVIGYFNEQGETIVRPWVMPLPWYVTAMQWRRAYDGTIIVSCVADYPSRDRGVAYLERQSV